MKLILSAAFGLVCMSNAAMAASAEGIWLSEDRDTKVQIVDCGGKLCGKVIWVDELIDPDTGKPKTDFHNPDPVKRKRPLIGLQVVNGLVPDGPDKWSGSIYNADDGRTYQASMKVQSANTAKVQGCVLRVLCKSHIWTRAN